MDLVEKVHKISYAWHKIQVGLTKICNSYLKHFAMWLIFNKIQAKTSCDYRVWIVFKQFWSLLEPEWVAQGIQFLKYGRHKAVSY